MLRPVALFLLLAQALAAHARIDVRVEPPPPAGRVIVEFTRGGGAIERLRRDVAMLDQRSGKRALDPIRHEYVHTLSGAALEVPAETLDAIRRLPYVRAVHADRTVRAAVIESTGAPSQINAVSLPARGEGMIVAVIDSGIDYRHPALGGGFGPGYKVAGGWDFVYGDADPLDENGHGTHVAGIIAGDSAELSGVAPGATLYAYKVLNGMGQGLQSDILAAIERSIDPNQDGDPSDHVDVINLSLGGPGHADDLASRAVDRATAAGVVVVVAAGNEGRPSSIGSPGTALTAITVGAISDDGAVTSFSSQGPGPVLLTFKPDVVAPGFQVVSARLGGGLIPMSGTSMASPYVAGVAALLRELHPDWTAADVRSALVTTAASVSDVPIRRGAGRVDAVRANAVTTFLDSSALSFGLAPGTTGFSEVRKVVTVTNRAAAARTIDLAAVTTPSGMTLTATPARLQLAPGASKTVELKLRVDNKAAAFPEQPVLSGVVGLRGEEPLDLPWIVMRAARLSLSSDLVTSRIIGISADGVKQAGTYDWHNAELFGRPGTSWDILVPAVESGDDLGPRVRIAALHDQAMTGDTLIPVPAASATAELELDVYDEDGRLLREVERERGGTSRWMTLSLVHDQGEIIHFHMGSWEKIYVSPMPWTLYPFQSSFDSDRERVYNVQHQVVRGVTGSKKLTVRPADYVHAIVNFTLEGEGPHYFGYCVMNGVRQGGRLFVEAPLGCFGPNVTRPPRVHYFATNESGDGGSGMGLSLSGEMFLPPLRAIDGMLVATDRDVSPADYRIANGEEIWIGPAPVYPRAFYGTTGGVFNSKWGVGGFYGPFNEWNINVTRGTAWTMYDAQGAVRSGGSIDPFAGPVAQPGDRLTAVRDWLHVSGLAAHGELEVQFGSDTADLLPPTLTSLRIENGLGRVTGPVLRNSAAALRFSAADLDYRLDANSRPLRGEMTRVWYRRSGAGAWQPLTVSITGSDTGAFLSLGRFPAGDLYRVDLSAATTALGPVDLRIELEDARGNRTSWTQAPAFVVSAPGKGRAVSR